MAQNEAFKRLLALEEEQDLWQREVLGERVWPMVRLRRYRAEYLDEGTGEEAGRGTAAPMLEQNKRNAERMLRSLAQLAGGGVSRSERDIWVLSSSGYRRKADDGTYRCIFAEHLRAQLGERLLFLELNNAGLDAASTEDTLFVDGVHRPMMWSARIGGEIMHRRPGKASPWGEGHPSRLLYERALYLRTMRRTARRWIARARPKAVFVVYGYGPWQPVQQAAREAGVPVIELQHGIIHGSHPGYVFTQPSEQLPGGIPDHLVVFGKGFGEALESDSPAWRGRWTVGGHPWLLKHLAGEAERPKRVVLFGQYDLPVQRVIAQTAAELAPLLPDWEVMIKPHPHELNTEEVYGTATAAGATLAGPRDDTYRLLPTTRLAVGLHSTVAIEALAAGCRSVLLPSSSRSDALQDFVEQGLLGEVGSAADIAGVAEEPGTADHGEQVAADLFGAGADPLDFEALIEQVTENLRAR